MLSFAIDALGRVQTQIPFFSFKSGEVSLEIILTTSYHLSVVFYFMRTVAFDTFRSMHTTHEGHLSLFLTIFTLIDTRIHICSLNCCNVTSDIKAFVDVTFNLGTTLRVLYINPNYCYIRFRKNFNNMGVESKNNVIENISSLENSLDNVWCYWKVSVFDIIENTQNLKI